MNTFNIKLIQYPNGTAQIRKYSKPLRSKQPSDFIESYSFFEETAFSSFEKECFSGEPFIDKSFSYGRITGTFHDGVLRKRDGITEEFYTRNPFDGKIVLSKGHFNISKKDKSNEKRDTSKTNFFHSANRAKNKIFEYGRCCCWEWFVTFTFSKDKVNDRYNYDECSKLIRKWLNNQRRNAPSLFYLIVPEQHKDGAWHFHGLLSNTGKINFSESGRKKRGKIIYNMSKWSYGFTTATKVTDTNAVSKYIGKYITKDLCEATKGKHRYFVSANMDKPETSTFFIDGVRDLSEEELSVYNDISKPEDRISFLRNIFHKEEDMNFFSFLEKIVDSLGQKIVHVSSSGSEHSFVDVNYFELQPIFDE